MYSLSVVESFARAWDGMVARLFKPFRIGKWFALGFSAWLAGLLDGGGSMSFPSHNDMKTLAPLDFDFAGFWADYGYIITTVGIVILILMIPLCILFLWLSSRGKFMFTRNAVDNTALISEPWDEYRSTASSLFWWRIGFGFITLGVFAVLGVAAFLLIWPFIQDESHWTVISISITAVILFAFLAVALIALVIQVFLNDFIIPIMMKHRMRTNEAWSYFMPIMKHHVPQLVLYLLFRMVIVVGAGIAILLGIIVTCCCLLFLMVIPYISAVVLLPYSLLMRLFSVEYLRGFGEDFDVFAAPAPATPPPELPGGEAGVPSPS